MKLATIAFASALALASTAAMAQGAGGGAGAGGAGAGGTDATGAANPNMPARGTMPRAGQTTGMNRGEPNGTASGPTSLSGTGSSRQGGQMPGPTDDKR